MENIQQKWEYCNNLTQYSRLYTWETAVGKLPLGGKQPIRIQSMTNTRTADVPATVAQCIAIANAGSDYVRVTAPAISDAKKLELIKNQLVKQGYDIPLIADIHFNPAAAEVAALHCEKVRINPGNYIDKKKFQQIEYSEAEYRAELDKIHAKLLPLLNTCKKHQTAIRIGTNHGSLSDRIMSRYGDTPLGMVESVMEFLRICVAENFRAIVISLKASNTRVMVQAYRLLVNSMQREGMHFPLHLGVTEAGEGEDGRIKSAVGIGTLLHDGIGDTIRISLTEAPELEIPVAQELLQQLDIQENIKNLTAVKTAPKNPFQYKKRETRAVANIGGSHVPVVIANLSDKEIELPAVGYSLKNSVWEKENTAADFLYLGKKNSPLKNAENLKLIFDAEIWANNQGTNNFPLFCLREFFDAEKKSDELNFVLISDKDFENWDTLQKLQTEKTVVLIAETNFDNRVQLFRSLFYFLEKNNCQLPVVLKYSYQNKNLLQLQLKAAADAGTSFIDGDGDGLMLDNQADNNSVKLAEINSTAFGILQASRVRSSRTEYISCPSCGRTLFDLQATTAKIRAKTSHLKNLKIGVMGCIVNGLGEMADADYGYVGTGIGKINLYKGQNLIKRNIPEANAVNELIALIEKHGDWHN